MSQPAFLVMPEWQGSSSSRAMRIAEGAALLREDLPLAARTDVPVPLEAGDALGTPVARLSSLMHARASARTAIAASAANGYDVPIVLGGDCAASLAGLEVAAETAAAESGRLAVLWFDAHPDLQHPSTSPSGAASGMTLRHALGDGAPDLASAHPIDPARTVLVGTREIDPEERTEIVQRGIRQLAAHGDADTLAAAVLAAIDGADRLYIHIDLDVLDPAEFMSVHTAVPFGLSVSQLTTAVRAAVAAVPLVGAAISEFAPASPEAAADDQPTVLRILAALTSGSARAAA
ncbi:arginase family protein [Leucobacter chromiireducens]|uniref:Arginase family protein n=1 Tax=Leucobacter chromiireducens subsp. solipictus TaxID=398235 RepID=A0ABS1SFJ3_9MICO|nr:arginase family protein [Leucobacter chromiireducens subsp. solipictus]